MADPEISGMTITEIARSAFLDPKAQLIRPLRVDDAGNIFYEVQTLSTLSLDNRRGCWIILDEQTSRKLMSTRGMLSPAAQSKFDAIPIPALVDLADRFCPRG